MSIKGKIMIRRGNENGEPVIVFVSHLNTNFGCWVTPVLNSDITHLTDEKDLIDFDYKIFQRMLYQWHIDEIPNLKNRYQELLKEWN